MKTIFSKKKQTNQGFAISNPKNFQHVKKGEEESENPNETTTEEDSQQQKDRPSSPPTTTSPSPPPTSSLHHSATAPSPPVPTRTLHANLASSSPSPAPGGGPAATNSAPLPSSSFPPPQHSQKKHSPQLGGREGGKEKDSGPSLSLDDDSADQLPVEEKRRKKGTITFRRKDKDKRPKLTETFKPEKEAEDEGEKDDGKKEKEKDDGKKEKEKDKKKGKGKRMMERYTSQEVEREREKEKEKEKKSAFFSSKSKKKDEGDGGFMISSPTHFQTKTAEALAEGSSDGWVSGKEIQYEKNGKKEFPGIASASVSELFSHLLMESIPASFRVSFFHSYRTFLSPTQLALKLKKELETGGGSSAKGAILQLKMSQDNSEEWKQQKEQLEKIQRKKVVVIFSEWLENDPWVLKDQDPEFQKLMKELVRLAKKDAEEGEDHASKAYEKAKKVVSETTEPETTEDSLEKDWPDMDDNEILEVAKQMTLIESSFIEKLTHVDLLQWENFILRVGEGEGEGNTPPNVAQIVGFFDTISNWVVTGVVSCPIMATRVKSLSNYIKLGEKLLELSNFSGVAQVLRGLSSPPVEFLKATWKETEKPILKRYQTLKSTLSSKNNYQKYWSQVQQAQAAQKRIIPYLSVHLAQLVELKESIPELTIENGEVQGMVDYKKTSEILSAVTNLLGYTGISEKNQLDLTIVPSVRQWLLERNPFTQEECFRWAQRIEPEDWELAVIQMISTQTLLQAKIESLKKRLDESEKKKQQKGGAKKRPIPPLLAQVSHGVIPSIQNTSMSRFKTKRDFVNYGSDDEEEEERDTREYSLTMTKEESERVTAIWKDKEKEAEEERKREEQRKKDEELRKKKLEEKKKKDEEERKKKKEEEELKKKQEEEEEEEEEEEDGDFLSLEEVKRRGESGELDRTCLEKHLSDKTFKKALGCTKEEFYKMQLWKQQKAKKQAGLD